MTASLLTLLLTPSLAAAQEVGIPACDDFIAKYEACVTGKIPAASQAEFANALTQWRTEWKKLAADPNNNMVSAGNFEGGDFNIIAPGVALVGYTDHRSEEMAARQIASWFIKEGWEIKYAPIDQFYVHIDLMVCMLNERCAAVCLDTTDDDIVAWLKAKKIEIIPASFRETMALGCNVVALGNDRVLSTEGAKELNVKMRAAGFRVYDPDMTMFTWAGGGVHCMCQPLRREAA